MRRSAFAGALLWTAIGLAALPPSVKGVGPDHYNRACALARAGDKAKALDELEAALDAGAGYGAIGSDPDLASLRAEPQFQALVARAKRALEPCLDAKGHPEYRQLDFWVGDWDVFGAGGTRKVGESSVRKTLKDCVLVENWRAGNGTEGKSFNKYDPATGAWEQFWVSDSGVTNHFVGHLERGELRYATEVRSPQGAYLRHLTFSKVAGGRVRQLSTRSTDGGKTWVTEYDFLYVPKKPAPRAASCACAAPAHSE